jgi:antitoxin ParD1/3/4
MTLNPEQEQFVQARVDSGQYKNADEVIHTAFQLLEKREQYEQWVKETREKVQIGLAELARGEGIDGETVIAQLREKISRAREAKE